jgi:hypothetical protein
MKVLAGIAILPLMIASALAQEVNYNFSKEANFAVFRTYAWVDIKGGSVDQLDQLTAKQLTSAIDAEFGRKGLRPAPAAQADLLVGFQAAITQERSITAYNTGFRRLRRQRSSSERSHLTSMTAPKRNWCGEEPQRRRSTLVRSRRNVSRTSARVCRSF